MAAEDCDEQENRSERERDRHSYDQEYAQAKKARDDKHCIGSLVGRRPVR